MKAVLYSTGCPHCKVLKQKLDSEGIEYEVCDDIKEMQTLGITVVPVLKIEDKLYNFSEAIQHMKELHRVEESQ